MKYVIRYALFSNLRGKGASISQFTKTGQQIPQRIELNDVKTIWEQVTLGLMSPQDTPPELPGYFLSESKPDKGTQNTLHAIYKRVIGEVPEFEEATIPTP